MERDIITVYCLIDEYLKLAGIKDDVRAEISNAEVLLIGYMAVNDFNGNYYKAHQYWVQTYKGTFFPIRFKPSLN